MAIDNAQWAAYIRGLKVPADMSNCRQFVDLLAANAVKGSQELDKTIAGLTAAMLEVINALGQIDEERRKGGA
jgi:hypothetical protein